MAEGCSDDDSLTKSLNGKRRLLCFAVRHVGAGRQVGVFHTHPDDHLLHLNMNTCRRVRVTVRLVFHHTS